MWRHEPNDEYENFLTAQLEPAGDLPGAQKAFDPEKKSYRSARNTS